MDIRRVSDADLQAAGLNYGRSVLEALGKEDPEMTRNTASVASTFGVRIYRLHPTDSALREIEKQLVDAYVTGGNSEAAGENLQKIGTDSLLFTKPLFKSRPDGSQEFDYAIGIKMATKTVVLSMPKP